MVIYDHLGNLVANTLLSDLVPEYNVKRAVLNSNTGDRWIINKVHKIRTRLFGGHRPLKLAIMLIPIVLGPTFEQYHSLRRSEMCLHSSQNM